MDRELIRTIMADKSLTPQERQRRVQLLHSPEIAARSIVVHPCQHYKKLCTDFHFICCDTIDQCHRCHIENRGCDVRPPKIDVIVCIECNVNQPPSKSCINCKVQFSKSHCSQCMIWTEPDICHCEKCGFCRLGGEGTLTHCDDCGLCYPNASILSHSCPQKSFRGEKCVVCLDCAYSSQKASVTTFCGHYIHIECQQNALMAGHYKCPVCRKSLIDMSRAWEDMRYSISMQPMPYMPVVAGDLVTSPFGPMKVLSISPVTAGEGRVSDATVPRGDVFPLQGLTGVIAEVLRRDYFGLNQPTYETRGDFMYSGILQDWQLARNCEVRATFNGKDVRASSVQILCNDCEKQSMATFHWIGTLLILIYTP